jgi:hypothetical protein
MTTLRGQAKLTRMKLTVTRLDQGKYEKFGSRNCGDRLTEICPVIYL